MIENTWIVLGKILLTVLLTGLIGVEREIRHKVAGLRTHILVGVGSTLVTLTSFFVAQTYQQPGSPIDPSRMIAGIITGIGFLCGGAIIRGGTQITGLTTAASLWIVSGIGMAIGCGQWITAIVVTAIVFFVLIGLRSIEKKLGEYFNYTI